MSARETMLSMDNPLSRWVRAAECGEQPRCPGCNSPPHKYGFRATGLLFCPNESCRVKEFGEVPRAVKGGDDAW